MLRGAGVTVNVLLAAAVLTFSIALIAGLGRISRNLVIRKVSGLYVEVFRGTSLLVQMFWVFYALPAFGIQLSAYMAGVLALGLNYGAYASEIVRGAILAIPKGQTEASIALNMTRWQRMRLVILPQAFKIMLPGFGNISIELLKGTSLVSLITLSDLTNQALTLRNTDLSYTMPAFVLLLVLYFIIALPLIYATRWFEQRASKGVAN